MPSYGVIEICQLHDYHTHLREHNDLHNYAVLESFADDSGPVGPYGDGIRGMEPGHGLLVLKIQNKVLLLLIDISKLVLHDLDDVQFISLPRPPQEALVTGDGGTASSIEQVSLAEISANAPYQSPTSVNLRQLEALAQARLEQLRVMLGYFVRIQDTIQISLPRVARTAKEREPTMLVGAMLFVRIGGCRFNMSSTILP